MSCRGKRSIIALNRAIILIQMPDTAMGIIYKNVTVFLQFIGDYIRTSYSV